MNESNFRPFRFLLVYILLAGLLWTLLPALCYTVPGLDAPEAVTWGSTFALGNSKHPPLSGWIVYLISALFGHHDFAIYLTSQLLMGIGFFYLYKLGREFFDESGAVMTALFITFYFFYNFELPKYSANTPHVALLPMTAYFFYAGVRHNRLADWLLCGVAAGLAFLTKYLALLPFFGMFCYMLCDKDARACFAKPGPYLAGIVFLLCVAPHAWWIADNGFSTIRYVSNLTAGHEKGYLGNIFNVVAIELAPLAAVAFAAYAVNVLSGGGFDIRSRRPSVPAAFRFGLFLVLTPLAVILVMAILGNEIEPRWLFQCFLFCGLPLAACFRQPVGERTFRVFAALCTLFAIVMMTVFAIYTTTASRHHRHWNIAEIDAFGARLFREKTGKEFPMVAGELWLAPMIQRYHKYQIDCASFGNPSSFGRLAPKFADGALLICDNPHAIESNGKKLFHQKITPVAHMFPYQARFGKRRERVVYFGVAIPQKESKPEASKP